MTLSSKLPGFVPRVVSIYELRKTLMPYMAGIPWAEDALMDLWRMGAPDPSPKARPCLPGTCRLGCSKKWGCRKERRILLPRQFAAWWNDVAERQGIGLVIKP